MKHIVSAALLFAVSTPAFAAPKLVCSEYNRSTQRLGQTTVVLEPASRGRIEEGTPFAYELQIYQGASVMPEETVEGTVVSEDVMFDFTAKEGATTFRVYMDEMNESFLTVNGKTTYFICR